MHDVFHCDDDLLFKSSSFGDVFCKTRRIFPSSCLVSVLEKVSVDMKALAILEI